MRWSRSSSLPTKTRGKPAWLESRPSFHLGVLAPERLMRWTRPLKTTFAAGSIATALVTSGPSFFSTVNPYPRATTGYDVSYPQCPGLVVAPDGAFGIVGVNGGKAFTYNPCLSREYKAAPRPPSLYINTGY